MMALLRNLLIGVLLAFSLLWGFTWFKVAGAVRDLVARAAPVAEINYRSIRVWPNGDVVLNGLNASSRLQPDTPASRVDELRIHTPGLLYLARFALGTGRSPPDELGLTLSGLHSPHAETFASRSGRTWLTSSGYVPFESFGCAELDMLLPEHYRDMGLDVPRQTQFIGYRMDRRNNRLTVRAEIDSMPLSRIELEALIIGIDPERFSLASLPGVRIERASLSYHDEGYMIRRNEWCAQQSDLGISRFLRAHVGEIEALAASFGASLDTRLLGVYRRLINEGGSAVIEIRPSASVPFERYPAYPADDIPRLLNLTARIADSGSVPVDLRFAETRQRQAEQRRLAEEGATDEEDDTEVLETAPSEPETGQRPRAPRLAEQLEMLFEAPPVATTPPERPVREAASPEPEPAEEASPPARRSGPVQPSIPIPKPGQVEQSVLPSHVVRIGPAPPRTLSYDELDSMIGRRIIVVTVGGQRRVGTLNSISAEGITMTVSMGGGSASVTIPRQGIREIRYSGRG